MYNEITCCILRQIIMSHSHFAMNSIPVCLEISFSIWNTIIAAHVEHVAYWDRGLLYQYGQECNLLKSPVYLQGYKAFLLKVCGLHFHIMHKWIRLCQTNFPFAFALVYDPCAVLSEYHCRLSCISSLHQVAREVLHVKNQVCRNFAPYAKLKRAFNLRMCIERIFEIIYRGYFTNLCSCESPFAQKLGSYISSYSACFFRI